MQNKKRRRRNGYALVSIIVIGAFSLAFLMALASMVTSAVRAVSANKWIESLRNAAEIGVDYAVAKYNSESPCSLDPVASPSKSSLTTQLGAEYLQSLPATAGSPNIQVYITVTEIFDSSYFTTLQASSSIYSPQLDPYNTALAKSKSPQWQSPASAMPLNVTGGGFRIVESMATNGISSRTIRVILKARFDAPPDGNPSPLTAGYSSTPGSYFGNPMFANQQLQVAPNAALTIQGLNSATGALNTTHPVTSPLGNYQAFDLNLMTNQQASVGSTTGGKANLFSDLTVLSSASGSNDVAILPNGTIQGRLITNGTPDFDPSNPAATVKANTGNQAATSDTVRASADGGTQRSGLNNTQPLQINPGNQQIAQNQLAPTEVPSSAQQLPQLSEITQAITPATGGSSYEIAGLNSQGLSSPVTFQNQTNPVQIFVDDSGSNTAIFFDPTSIKTSATADARNLQIYYQGTDAVTINIPNGATFNGLIYAPNAPVTIQSPGSTATFTGAVVGNSVNVTMSGTMNLYTDLGATGNSKAGLANAATGLQYQTALVNGQQTILVQGWQPVTWQEFNPLNNQPPN